MKILLVLVALKVHTPACGLEGIMQTDSAEYKGKP